MPKPHQVFISYSSKDEGFANNLAEDLKKKGVKVWIATKNISPGSNWVDEIEKGLGDSNYFLLVLTPDAMESPWVNLEIRVAFDWAVRNKIIFIPLYVRELTKTYPLLNTIQQIDFRGDFKKGIEQLIEALEISDDMATDRTEINIPYLYNPYFVGQENALEEIHKALNAGNPVGLIGDKGIGKTQILLEYAYTTSHPDGVYWINAFQSLEEGLLDIAEELGWEAISASPNEITRNVWNELSRKSEALVIIDNLADAEQLTDYLQIDLDQGESSLQCKVLFTLKSLEEPKGCAIWDYIQLQEKEAIHVLTSRSNPDILTANISDPLRKTASKICQRLEYHPLSLSLSSAYLLNTQDELEDYYEQLDETPKQVIEFDNLPPSLSKRLSTILHLQLTHLNEEEQNILKTASMFRESRYIPTGWLNLLTDGGDNAEQIEHMLQLSLVEKLTDKRVCLHPIIHQFISAISPKTEREAFQNEIENNLVEKLTKNENDHKLVIMAADLIINLDWKPVTMRKPIVDALWAIIKNRELSDEIRCDAGFKLMKLRWFDKENLPSEKDFLIYLEAINRSINSPVDIKYQISVISHVIENRVIDPHQTEYHRAALDHAHILCHRSALQATATLSYMSNDPGADNCLDRVKSGYREALSFLKNHESSGAFQPKDNILSARTYMALGRIIRDYDKKPNQALEHHEKALEAAKKYLDDPLLLTTILTELTDTLASLQRLEEADDYCNEALTYITPLRKNNSKIYADYYAFICEAASIIHWDWGENFHKKGENNRAIQEFSRAYRYPTRAIDMLNECNMSVSEGMVYAHRNAADCLSKLITIQDYNFHPECPSHVKTKEQYHWAEVKRLAQLVGLTKLEDEADEHLQQNNSDPSK